MKGWVLLMLFLIACVPQAPQPVVEEKIVEKVVVQCWDGSTAESLDKCPPKEEKQIEPGKEVIVEPAKPAETPAGQIAQQLLDAVNQKFTGVAYILADRFVIKYKNQGRIYFTKMVEFDGKPMTDIYLDFDKKTAAAYCNLEREGRMSGDSFDYERSRCKDYIDKPIAVDFNKWQSKGPIEWLEEFANREPVRVETSLQTISIGGNSKSIQPSLHYIVDGKSVVLRIDKRYGVPIKIELEGQQSVDFRETFFDVMVIEGKQQKIDQTWMVYQPVSDYWKAKGQ